MEDDRKERLKPLARACWALGAVQSLFAIGPALFSALVGLSLVLSPTGLLAHKAGASAPPPILDVFSRGLVFLLAGAFILVLPLVAVGLAAAAFVAGWLVRNGGGYRLCRAVAVAALVVVLLEGVGHLAIPSLVFGLVVMLLVLVAWSLSFYILWTLKQASVRLFLTCPNGGGGGGGTGR